MATVRKRVRIAATGEEKISWVADYFDQHKKRHIQTFKTRKAAAAWLVETLGEVTRGVHTPERASITVYAAAQLWLDRGKVEELEKGTMRGYEAIVELHIGPTIGTRILAELSTPVLEDWRDRLLAGTPTHPAVTRYRARRIVACLKAILGEAQRRGLIAHNPATPVKVDLKRRNERKLAVGKDIPGKDDIQALLAAAAGNRHRPLIVTAALTGMRASELRGLAWDAVDFDRKVITVRQRADEWGTIGAPKSKAGHREIPMMDAVVNTLREWKLACPKGDLNLVFPNQLGKVEPLSNIAHRVWHPLQEKAGLVDDAGKPRFNFHALPHFFASLGIEQGFSPKRLQSMLGHSSIQMTFDRYGHLFPSLEDDHAKLNRGMIGLVA
jgi:integrase